MQASLGSTFLIVFREALEAGLIIGIILTVLARMRAQRYIPHVLAGVAAAFAASWGAAVALNHATAGASEQANKIIEGVVSLIACVIVTYMVFWMHRQARYLKSHIEATYSRAVPKNDLLAMVALPFVAVFREGVETVLFLQAIALQSGEAVSWIGGLAGLALATVVTLLIFAGGRRIALKPLFQWTGYFLIFISAGLLAYGIHELEEAGWLPPLIEHVYNINSVLNEKAGIGSFLKALFGYNGNPSLLEVSAYWAYLAAILYFLHRSEGEPAPAHA